MDFMDFLPYEYNYLVGDMDLSQTTNYMHKGSFTTLNYSPGEASLGILTSIHVTVYGAVLHSKCKD